MLKNMKRALMSLFAAGQLLAMSSAMALSTDPVKTENRGKVAGFRNSASHILSGLGMLLGNYLYASFPPKLPFYTALSLIAPAFNSNVFGSRI
jgi:MFS family permease